MNAARSGGGGGDESDGESETRARGVLDRPTRNANVLDQLKFLKEEVEYNRSRINAIEGKLSGFDQPRRTYSGPEPTAYTEVTDDSQTTRDYMFLTDKKTIPKVRECTYAQFKNRFHPRGEDGRFAVDVLLSGPLLHQETLEERSLRARLFEQRGPAPVSARIVKDKNLSKAVTQANTVNDLIEQAQSGAKWPRRIRIQAPALLRILGKVNNEKWSDRPRTYYRPFHALIFQHEEMREVLEGLEKRWGPQLDGEAAPVTDDEKGGANGDEDPDLGSGDDSPDGDEDADDSVIESPKALACMREYVKYMDQNIMPDYYRFENMDVSSNAKVRFSDLWYLFRTGELVYRPVDGELPDRRDFRTGKRIWQTYYIDPRSERQSATASDDPDTRDPAEDRDDTAFRVGCYYIDYTGDGFCVVKDQG